MTVGDGKSKFTRAGRKHRTSGHGDLLPEAYRLQGALLLQQVTPDAAQAEVCFQQALAIARCQRAQS